MRLIAAVGKTLEELKAKIGGADREVCIWYTAAAEEPASSDRIERSLRSGQNSSRRHSVPHGISLSANTDMKMTDNNTCGGLMLSFTAFGK